MAPRETENNAYAKFWSDQQRVLWYVMKFSGVVNFHRQIKKSKKYRQAITKKVRLRLSSVCTLEI